ncbi:hypothetical protein VQH23_12930 [Pararoseomonas sp. SCSIO 73927]|uniref:hypothetical protein n=1 Tax=Pararoseomonas sp. SCSIO 73927 TaxID=3114537 RepID=UPI0030D3BF67
MNTPRLSLDMLTALPPDCLNDALPPGRRQGGGNKPSGRKLRRMAAAMLREKARRDAKKGDV